MNKTQQLKKKIAEYDNLLGFKKHGSGYSVSVKCEGCGEKFNLGAYHILNGKDKFYHNQECYDDNGRETHAMTGTPIYKAWERMKKRCNNPNDNRYEYYGGRGIEVCDRWKNSFENFYEDMKEGFEEGLTLDRIDNNKNYSPDNCRWATKEEQPKNKRTVKLYEWEGEEYTIPELAHEIGIKPSTMYARLKTFGWNLQRAMTEPVRTNH